MPMRALDRKMRNRMVVDKVAWVKTRFLKTELTDEVL